MNNGPSRPHLEINFGIPDHSRIDDFDEDFDRFHAWRFLLDLQTKKQQKHKSLWVLFMTCKAIIIDTTRNTRDYSY